MDKLVDTMSGNPWAATCCFIQNFFMSSSVDLVIYLKKSLMLSIHRLFIMMIMIASINPMMDSCYLSLIFIIDAKTQITCSLCCCCCCFIKLIFSLSSSRTLSSSIFFHVVERRENGNNKTWQLKRPKLVVRTAKIINESVIV